jgi:DNA-3-methyladenine glycosylase II
MAAQSPSYTRAALAHLRRADSRLAHLIAKLGPYRITRRPDSFQALVRAIIFQQLAGAAALAIYGRFVALFGDSRFPRPAQVVAVPAARMRRAGLSGKKILYVKGLARAVNDGSLNFRRFPHMQDEEIIAELVKLKGIGRWTAEMFLMFNLWRPDVLPVDDLGFRNAVKRIYGMRKMPTAHQLRRIAEPWRPYRSVAVWYLWRSGALITPGDTARKTMRR